MELLPFIIGISLIGVICLGILWIARRIAWLLQQEEEEKQRLQRIEQNKKIIAAYEERNKDF